MTTAGPSSNSEFIAPDQTSGYVSADSTGRVSLYTPYSDVLQESGGSVVGSSSASGELKTASGRITSESKLSAKSSVESSSMIGESLQPSPSNRRYAPTAATKRCRFWRTQVVTG